MAPDAAHAPPPAPLHASFRAPVDAPAGVIWRLLEDKVENPGRYVQGATDVRVLDRFADGIMRQMTLGRLVLKERIVLDPERLEMTFTLVDHPLFEGRVVNRVHLPRAGGPCELEFDLCWSPRRPLSPEETPDVAAAIRNAVLHTKALAEGGG